MIPLTRELGDHLDCLDSMDLGYDQSRLVEQLVEDSMELVDLLVEDSMVKVGYKVDYDLILIYICDTRTVKS